MAYLEIRKDGRLVSRKDVDAGSDGYVHHLDDGGEVRLEPGRTVHQGGLDYRLVLDEDASAKGPLTVSDTGSVSHEQPPTVTTNGPLLEGSGLEGVSSVASGTFPEVEGYRITGQLGEGGSGVVWRAVQLDTRRDVALKLMSLSAIGSNKARMRFEREVELASRLEHPNIARIYDGSLHHGGYYYAMELVDGVRLDEYVSQNKLKQRQVLELMKTVAEAVQHAHQRGVIHRDLKPSNILVGQDGKPSVLDFGLAKSFLDEQVSVSVFTMNGELAGTVPYMSPEQAAGRIDELDTRTDVYSLGVILYELLTGKLPHDMEGSRWAALRRIAEEEVTRPRQITKEIDGELESLLLKALALDPALRYASAGELARDIGNYLSGEPLTAKKPTIRYVLRKRLRKYRVHAAIALSVAALVVGVWTFLQSQEDERAEAAQAKLAYERALGRTRPENISRFGGRAWADAREMIERAEASTDPDEIAACYRRAKELLPDAVYAAVKGWSYECLRTFTGHEGRVYSVAFNPDGRLAVSGSADSTLKLWNLRTGKCVRTFTGHTDNVNSVAFSPDGRFALSGSLDNTLKLWKLATGKCVRTFTGHENAVNSVAFSPDGLSALSGSHDNALKLWNLRTGKCVRTFTGHTGWVSSVAFSPDGLSALSGSWDKTLKLWKLATGKCVRTFTGHRSGVGSVAFSPDGLSALSGSWDNTLKLWNVATGECVRTFKGHKDYALSVAFSPDGLSALSGSDDRTLKLWELATGKCVRTFTGHTDDVNSVAFSPDGLSALSGSEDNALKLWDLAKGECLWTIAGQGEVYSVAFGPDGLSALSGSEDKTLKLWDLVGGERLRTFTGHRWDVLSVAFSPDGLSALSGSFDTTVKLWDLVTGECVWTFTGPGEVTSLGFSATSVAFSPDGRLALSGSWYGSKLWDLTTGECVRTFAGHAKEVYSVAFSPDGRLALSGSMDCTLKLWDVSTGKCVRTSTGHGGVPLSVAFSPDGRFALSGSPQGTLKLWDVSTGEWVRTLTGHKAFVNSVAFSPDGRFALSGSGDRTLKLWNLRTGRCVRTFTGHTDAVRSVAFSPDGLLALSGSEDGTIKLWDLSPPDSGSDPDVER